MNELWTFFSAVVWTSADGWMNGWISEILENNENSLIVNRTKLLYNVGDYCHQFLFFRQLKMNEWIELNFRKLSKKSNDTQLKEKKCIHYFDDEKSYLKSKYLFWMNFSFSKLIKQIQLIVSVIMIKHPKIKHPLSFYVTHAFSLSITLIDHLQI